MGAVSFQNVEPLAYENIYYHDYHGWRDTKKDTTKAFNAFTAESNEQLESISFYTATNNVVYKVVIYDYFIQGQLKNALSTISGTIDYKGFHTIDLQSPVGLTQDDDFYIYVELSDGGQAYDRTSEIEVLLATKSLSGVTVRSDSNPGESYYYDGSTWKDLYDYDETANFCIKGLTNPWTPTQPDLESQSSISLTDVKPGSKVTASFTVKNIGELLSCLDWEITEYPNWGVWKFTPLKGNDLKPEGGEFTIELIITAPVQKNEVFSGEIKIVNKENPNDFSIIPVALQTAKNKNLNKPILSYLIVRIIDNHPLIDRLLSKYY
jgi:hypothetical protein